MFITTSVVEPVGFQQYRTDHSAYLVQMAKNNDILTAGLKDTADGGVIWFTKKKLGDLAALMAVEPLAARGILTFNLLSFDPKPEYSKEGFLELLEK